MLAHRRTDECADQILGNKHFLTLILGLDYRKPFDQTVIFIYMTRPFKYIYRNALKKLHINTLTWLAQ